MGSEEGDEDERPVHPVRLSAFALDRAWADHLAVLSELREGSHLARLGSEDPLRQFIREADRAYGRFVERVEADVARLLDELAAAETEPYL